MKKQAILLILIALMIIGLLFDKSILNFIVSSRTSFLNAFFIFISKYFNEFLIAIVITLLALIKKNKNLLFQLWLSFISSGILVYILKIIIQRPRPLLNLIEETSSSFPSGHSTIMFALLPIIWRNSSRPIKYIWLSLSILIAFSRIYLGVHFFSDVIGGLILGLIIGENIIKLNSPQI